jgi:sugar/nucleoside kinase (ribokinase family)
VSDQHHVPNSSPAPATIDVLGVGNALVDVLSSSADSTLEELGMVKGSMDLIDEDRMAVVYAAMGQGTELSGGSAANTMAGLASLGINSSFLGRVRDDFLGTVFEHDLEAIGVGWSGSTASDGPPTGCCLILVTPDAERTMNTFLGASSLLGSGDIDVARVAEADIVYLEGYLFDRDEAKEAYEVASRAAHDAGRRVALTLSDTFCVIRHREAFAGLVHSHVDILFSNHDELLALYETDDLDAAIAEVRSHCPLAVVTLGEAGAVIVTPTEEVRVGAKPIERIVDTTGAGDQFAAGFLAGIVRGRPLEECGQLGALAAAEVISHLGPRPQVVLFDLAPELLAPSTER